MSFSNNQSSYSDSFKGEIDLRIVLDRILRNKKFIISFSLGGFILSGIIGLNVKKSWQGQFQIVIKNPSESILSQLPAALDGLVSSSFKKDSNSLDTEIEILRSPSVLIDIFNFAKEEKLKENKKFKNLSYSAWKKNLDLKIKRRTTVLNITYTDPDKDLVLPVLNKISSTFQEYYANKKLKELNQTAVYLKGQISLYENKSNSSLKNLQEFAVDNDLSVSLEEENLSPEIESIRVKATNKLRYLENLLSKVESVDRSQIPFILDTEIDINDSIIKELKSEISTINSILIDKESAYKENDFFIKDLKKKRDLLFVSLKNNIISLIKAQIENSRSQIISASRPKKIISEYLNLNKQAIKDQAILSQLEDKNRILMLEKSKIENPWELITQPRLLPSPIGIRRSQLLILGLFSGLIFGSLYKIYLEKKTGLFFSTLELENIFEMKFIDKVSINQFDKLKEKLNFFLNITKKENNKNTTWNKNKI